MIQPKLSKHIRTVVNTKIDPQSYQAHTVIQHTSEYNEENTHKQINLNTDGWTVTNTYCYHLSDDHSRDSQHNYSR